jgi:hypothetical protein
MERTALIAAVGTAECVFLVDLEDESSRRMETKVLQIATRSELRKEDRSPHTLTPRPLSDKLSQGGFGS